MVSDQDQIFRKSRTNRGPWIPAASLTLSRWPTSHILVVPWVSVKFKRKWLISYKQLLVNVVVEIFDDKLSCSYNNSESQNHVIKGMSHASCTKTAMFFENNFCFVGICVTNPFFISNILLFFVKIQWAFSIFGINCG